MSACAPALDRPAAHHWKITPPDGEFSLGRCVHCGATRQFRNWIPDVSYNLNSEYRVEREEAQKLHGLAW